MEVVEYGQSEIGQREALPERRARKCLMVAVDETLAFQGAPGGDRDVRRGVGVHVEGAAVAPPDPARRTGQDAERGTLIPRQGSCDGG